MQRANDNHEGGNAVDREMLIRDVAVLQVKLIVDGLRDFILVPVSLVSGLISLFRMGDPAGTEFYQLLRLGRKSERWINLFGAFSNAPPEVVEEAHFGNSDMDEIIGRMETYVIDEYRRGGVTAQAKEQFDKALTAVRRRHERRHTKP